MKEVDKQEEATWHHSV